MKLLLIHNFYQRPGGEDRVVAAERALLSSRGHDVTLVTTTNQRIDGLGDELRAATRLRSSRAVQRGLERLLRATRPDLVHAHNLFPLLTPAIFDACYSAGVPTVFTLHNYRLLCANGVLFRDGRVCEECLRHSVYRSIYHGCYRGSRAATLPVAHSISWHRARGTWRARVGRFIALSEFARDKFVEGGLPRERINVKSNFVAEPVPPPSSSPRPEGRARALYVGRLSVEKGIETLLRAWRGSAVPLRVIGDGPLVRAVRAARGTITCTGWLEHQQVAGEMRAADFLVLTSVCYEGAPLVLLEAFAHGLPVIASNLGAVGRMIAEAGAGLLYEPGSAESLRKSAERLAQDAPLRSALSARARRYYLEWLTPERSYPKLMTIYERAIAEGPRR